MDSCPRRGTEHRALAWLAVGMAGALLALTWLASPAGAHAALLESSPGQGEQVEEAPEEVVLVFNERMGRPATIEVTDPEGESVVRGEVRVEGERVAVSLDSLDVAGTYTVDWRAVSADDHPLDGSLAFEVTAVAVEDPSPDRPGDGEETIDEAEDDGAGSAEPGTGEGAAPEVGSADDTASPPEGVGAAGEAGTGLVPWLLGAAGFAAVAATAGAVWAQRRAPGRATGGA